MPEIRQWLVVIPDLCQWLGAIPAADTGSRVVSAPSQGETRNGERRYIVVTSCPRRSGSARRPGGERRGAGR